MIFFFFIYFGENANKSISLKHVYKALIVCVCACVRERNFS